METGGRGHASKARGWPSHNRSAVPPFFRTRGCGKSKRLTFISPLTHFEGFCNSFALPAAFNGFSLNCSLKKKKSPFSHLRRVFAIDLLFGYVWAVSCSCQIFPTHLQTERGDPAEYPSESPGGPHPLAPGGPRARNERGPSMRWAEEGRQPRVGPGPRVWGLGTGS